MEFKINVPKVDIGSYRQYWRGQPKVGKTTLFRDIVIALYGRPDAGLLIATGDELGYKAIPNLYGVEAINWGKFTEIIDELVQNPDNNNFEIIAIDTVDELVNIATKQVFRIHLQKKSERIDSINQALGGYGAGQRKVISLIKDQLSRLERAGYGIVMIGHTKVKEITEKGGETYQQLTGSLDGRYDSLFVDMADVVATLYIDKKVEGGELSETLRWIYFRGDGFVEAGTRFPDIPERVPMNAQSYIEAIEHGVRSALDGVTHTEVDIEDQRKKEVLERKKEGKAYTKLEKTGSVENAEQLNTAEDYINLIDTLVSQLTNEDKRKLRLELQESDIDVKAYKNFTDIEMLKIVLKAVQE